jgi:hypothetical protein
MAGRSVVPFACVVTLVAVAGCGGGGGGGGGGTPAFSVTSVFPADNAVAVPRDVVVRVKFSKPIDPASLLPNSLSLGILKFGAIAGGVSMPASDTLDFAANSTLLGGTNYFTTVHPGLRSTGGEKISGTLLFAFKTAGSPSDVVLPSARSLRVVGTTMRIGRRNHTATLLDDGRVLIAGGFVGGSTTTNSGELFSPATETFAFTGGLMQHARGGHTATKLASGRVLLAGGWRETSPGVLEAEATAEIFDPVTNLFTEVGPMLGGRADHQAIPLPDGRVVVAGGSRPVGPSFTADLDSVEAFSPGSGTWSTYSTLVHTRSAFGAADLHDGRWLLAGGSDVDFRYETFDTSTGAFTPVAVPGPEPMRFGPAVASYASGNVAVSGGDSLGTVAHFWRDSSAVTWTGSPLNASRAYATATPIGPDRILVAGGIDFSQGSLILHSCDLVMESGPAGSRTYGTQLWFQTGMADHAATLLADGRVLFTGGLNPNYGQAELKVAYLFTP